MPTGGQLLPKWGFGTGDGWGLYGDIEYTIEAPYLYFHRTFPGWRGASVFQQSSVALPEDISLQFVTSLGNKSDVPKRVEVTLRPTDWADVLTCAVTVPPNSSTKVIIHGQTETVWRDIIATLRLYDRDDTPSIEFGSMFAVAKLDENYRDKCEGVEVPTETNLVYAGGFGTNWIQSWVFWGDADFTRENGAMRFHRPPGATRPAVLFSDIAHYFKPNQPIQLTLQLGNTSSSSSKTVEVVLRDFEWKQDFTCTYTIPPNTPLTPVRMQGVTDITWGHPMLLIRSENTDGEAGILVDNADVRIKPNMTVSSPCGNPSFSSAADPVVPDGMKAPPTILPDGGTLPDADDNANPVPIAPPNPGGVPQIPGF